MKNINKISLFVILSALSLAAGGCEHLTMSQKKGTPPSGFAEVYAAPERTGTFGSDEIRESSGLAVSACQSGVFWTHNDSGDTALIYAFAENGSHLGAWKVTGAENKDWEDMALRKEADGNCYLYIGDIGNNKNEKESSAIYRVKEPTVSAETRTTSRKQPADTSPSEKLTFFYPDGRPDAEALMIHPETGNIYVVTKLVSKPAGVYRIEPKWGSAERISAVKVGEVALPAVPNGLVTGGDISPDGKGVIIADYFAGYVLKLPDGAADFEEVWNQSPVPVNIGERKNGEAVAFSPDGAAVYSTSEGKNAPIYRIRPK